MDPLLFLFAFADHCYDRFGSLLIPVLMAFAAFLLLLGH